MGGIKLPKVRAFQGHHPTGPAAEPNTNTEGGTVTGTTNGDGNAFVIGTAQLVPDPTRAWKAVLIVDGPSTGGLYFGRNGTTGGHLLNQNDSYVFASSERTGINVAQITVRDNGVKTSFTIDYTGA
jgi:hypothetical protein